jgi:hypothetical protein
MTDTRQLCEYHRCGGKGKRVVKQQWNAHRRVFAEGRYWHVCEGCAVLLLRTEGSAARAKRPHERGLSRLGDFIDNALSYRPPKKQRRKKPQKSVKNSGTSPTAAARKHQEAVVADGPRVRTQKPTIEELEFARRETERERVGEIRRSKKQERYRRS